MPRLRSSGSLLLSIGLLVGLSALGTGVAGAATPSCTQGQVSAIDEYCETVPTSTGPRAPSRRTASTEATLPRAAAQRLARGPYRQLLTLPGASSTARHPAEGRNAAPSASVSVVPARVSSWSALTGLIVALAVGTAALGAFAAVRRRRHAHLRE